MKFNKNQFSLTHSTRKYVQTDKRSETKNYQEL